MVPLHHAAANTPPRSSISSCGGTRSKRPSIRRFPPPDVRGRNTHLGYEAFANPRTGKTSTRPGLAILSGSNASLWNRQSGTQTTSLT
jgi:hypothetical protein